MYWRDDIDPGSEPRKVMIKRGEFVDEAREGRKVPYKTYYPDELSSEKLPVILWSHGLGGSRDGAGYISRFIAAHGFILVHMTHPGTDASLWMGKEGHPWDILRNVTINRETTLERFLDIPFIIDQLQMMPGELAEIIPHMDFDQLGMSGHSFGAMTTQVLAGQLFPDENHMLASYQEDRFKAGIVYSPNPIRHLVSEEGLEPKIYGSIAIPLFHMTGTEDASPISGDSYERRLSVYEHSGHPEKYLLIKEGGDHMVYNGTRGQLADNPLRDQHEEMIKVSSLAFWEAQLKDDEKAKEWLKEKGLSDYLAEGGQYSFVSQD